MSEADRSVPPHAARRQPPQRRLDTVIRAVRELQVQDLIKTGDSYRRVIGLRQTGANAFVVTVVTADGEQRQTFDLPGDISLVVAKS